MYDRASDSDTEEEEEMRLRSSLKRSGDKPQREMEEGKT